MKTLIVYYSAHHGNTKKLLDAVAEAGDVTLLAAADAESADFSEYDAVGFASGIYYGKFSADVVKRAEKLQNGQKTFFIYTCGSKKDSYTEAIEKTAKSKGAEILGSYGCLGFDTFGPFKIVGGIAKGRPNDEDIKGCVDFYKGISG